MCDALARSQIASAHCPRAQAGSPGSNFRAHQEADWTSPPCLLTCLPSSPDPQPQLLTCSHCAPPSRFQRAVVPSKLADARNTPPGDQATERIVLLCVSSRRDRQNHAPPSGCCSQRRTVLSLPQVAMQTPAAEGASGRAAAAIAQEARTAPAATRSTKREHCGGDCDRLQRQRGAHRRAPMRGSRPGRCGR